MVIILIFKKKDEVIIRSNWLTGTSIDQKKFESKITDEEYFTWGSPFVPKGSDPRVTEYRFYHKNGKPSKIEIFTIGRDKDGNAIKSGMFAIDLPHKT